MQVCAQHPWVAVYRLVNITFVSRVCPSTINLHSYLLHSVFGLPLSVHFICKTL